MRVAFATLGCKVNQYDTGTIETVLRRDGCTIVPFKETADVYVVNTCTVTDRADAESRQLVRRARRLNPGARVVVTGCFAQTSPQAVAALPEVDYVIGIGRLPDVLRAVRGDIDASAGRVLVDDLRKADRVTTLGAEVFGGQTRAFLKIQEGCDLFCTFCIVPFARGRSRSVPPRDVLDQLRRLAAQGFREVVLTGIHLGSYGEDLTPAIELADLVEMIAELRPVRRARLSSIDPPEVSTRLLECIAASDVWCPHLHVPVQAGADPVLRRMRRQYDASLLHDVLEEIRRVLPQAGLGTDVIAGFPGETNADFAATCELLADGPFTYAHVFPYSRRSGTTAAKYPDHISPADISSRARVLRRIAAAKRRAFAERFLGRDVAVLVEHTRDRDSGLPAGYSRSYLRVLVPGGESWMGSELTVRLVERRGDRAVGTATAGARDDVENYSG
jgi:threonylcarbamoyladenosine tRNA methylthiotransferase MtaB